MYARGFEFMPIDLYRAEPHRFQIIDGKLMPSFNSIEGLGDNAAVAIAEAAKDGPFLSKDDFRERTKVSKTIVELMSDLKLLGDIPESNQLSLFDFTQNTLYTYKFVVYDTSMLKMENIYGRFTKIKRRN